MKTVTEAINATSDLIEFTASNDNMECWKLHSTAAKKSPMQPSDKSCLSWVDPKWGGPLTAKQYDALCPSCRAYWHLSAARNDLIEYQRRK
jgi:hypothetical protein